MKTLDYQAVKDAGYDDEQLQRWLISNPEVKLTNYKRPTLETPNIQNLNPQQAQSAIVQQAQKTILPKKFPLTQEFGRYNPSLYRGVTADLRNPGADFGTPTGTEVSVPEGQWVVEEQGTGYNSGWGNSILLKNLKNNDRIRLSHLSQMARLKPGEVVESGELIAKTGATGNVAGSHLDITYFDPYGYKKDILKSPYANLLFPQ